MTSPQETRMIHTPPTRAEQSLRTQVAAALLAHGISQAEAARRLGLSNKHLNQMLTGRAPLALHWAERILHLCGMRIVIGLQHDVQEHR